MDGAVATSLCSTVGAGAPGPVYAPTSRRVAAVRVEGAGASPAGAAAGADLGGSSEYSDETSEDRSGEGFHVNSS